MCPLAETVFPGEEVRGPCAFLPRASVARRAPWEAARTLAMLAEDGGSTPSVSASRGTCFPWRIPP
ncbi:hypothetical protein PtB15_4B270 [Puccinia triticina]|nr:hypothetical protein PtB15_4B270 [Puccinia triticina]